MTRIISFLFIIAVFLAALLNRSLPEAAAQSSEDPRHLKVATKEIEPFVFINGNELSGFSIDLWDALALEAGFTYDFEIVETVLDQIDVVATGEVDAAIAAISITAAREERIDFSHRYFESGLGILTKSGGTRTVLDSLRIAFSPSLLRLFAFLVITILISGHIIWLIERNRNPEFPSTYLRGVWEGIWWAAVTVTTVGYGDKTPIGRIGRVFGIFWMFAGLFIIANFTAGVTSQLTLEAIQGTINGPEDLQGKQVATVAGSTANEWLIAQGIANTAVETVDEAYALLDAERVQAVVYDHPVLLYYALQNEEDGYRVPGGSFNKEDYGIAVPEDSPLREEFNRALLALVEDGTYQRIYSKWYGAAGGS